MEFSFQKYSDLNSAKFAVDAIQISNGGTRIGEALKLVKTDMFNTARSNVPRMLLVMTDGRSSDDVVAPSRALRDIGVTILTLGLGSDYDLDQLKMIASGVDLVFESPFDQLPQMVEKVQQKACPADLKDKTTLMTKESDQQESSTVVDTQSIVPATETCSVQFHKMSCYSNTDVGASLEELQLFTDRDTKSAAFSGNPVDWGHWDAYMSRATCRCANQARTKKYKFFSIRNYGECWSGQVPPRASPPSDSCITTEYNKCQPQDSSLCVGDQHSSFVYRIDDKSCDVQYTNVGCYSDSSDDKPRPFTELLTNDLPSNSTLWSHRSIDWKDWDEYLDDAVCRCARNANVLGNTYFAIHNYGECWSAKDVDVTYNDHAESTECISYDFKPCPNDDGSGNCAGIAKSDYVYKIVQTS